LGGEGLQGGKERVGGKRKRQGRTPDASPLVLCFCEPDARQSAGTSTGTRGGTNSGRKRDPLMGYHKEEGGPEEKRGKGTNTKSNLLILHDRRRDPPESM